MNPFGRIYCALGILFMLRLGCSTPKPFANRLSHAEVDFLKADRWQGISRAVVMISTMKGEYSCKQGNGVIVSEDGLVLTLSHVLDSKRPDITLFDGRRFKGEILFRNPQTDIAIIKISHNERLPFLPMAKSPAKIGESACVIGRRGEPSAIVTSEGRVLMGEVNFYAKNLVVEKGTLHSAPIQQGLSGSALVSTSGELLAINAMFFGEKESGKSAALGVGRYREIMDAGLLSSSHTSRMDTSTTPKISGLPNEVAWVLAGLENHSLQTGQCPEKTRDIKQCVLHAVLKKCDKGELKNRQEAQGEAWAAFLRQSVQ